MGQLQDLIKENLLLRTESNFYKGKDIGKGTIRNWGRRMTTNTLIGKGIKESVLQLYEEIPDQKVTKDTLVEFTSPLIIRIGTFILLIITSLCIKSFLLFSSNDTHQKSKFYFTFTHDSK